MEHKRHCGNMFNDAVHMYELQNGIEHTGDPTITAMCSQIVDVIDGTCSIPELKFISFKMTNYCNLPKFPRRLMFIPTTADCACNKWNFPRLYNVRVWRTAIRSSGICGMTSTPPKVISASSTPLNQSTT